MESTVLAAIVGASSAIATNIIASIVNTRTASKARMHDLEKEMQRARFDFLKLQSEKSRQHYERAHVLLSILQREFSLTSISIDWGAKLTTGQWDTKYRELCRQADELRMIASLFGSSVSEPVEVLYGEMNVYWGNFRTFLYRIEQGDKVDWQSPGYKDAHAAANKVGGLAERAKDALRAKVDQKDA